MIYTSYFANWRKFPEGASTVSIARFNPKWSSIDIHALELAPSADLLLDYKNDKITEEEYDSIYQSQLDKLNPQDIFDKYDGKVLLCYEKSCDFCHRFLFSNWMKKHGFEVEEL